MCITRSGTWLALALLVTTPLAAQSWGETVRGMVDSAAAMGGRFKDGSSKRSGHLGDKLIEGTIEAVTPEADEETRRVQRAAIKAAADPDVERQGQHMDELQNAAASAGIAPALSGGESRAASGEGAASPRVSYPEDSRRVWIVSANGTRTKLEAEFYDNRGGFQGRVFSRRIGSARVGSTSIAFVLPLDQEDVWEVWTGRVYGNGDSIVGTIRLQRFNTNGEAEYCGSKRTWRAVSTSASVRLAEEELAGLASEWTPNTGLCESPSAPPGTSTSESHGRSGKALGESMAYASPAVWTVSANGSPPTELVIYPSATLDGRIMGRVFGNGIRGTWTGDSVSFIRQTDAGQRWWGRIRADGTIVGKFSHPGDIDRPWWGVPPGSKLPDRPPK
jgi:hypothetical protein